MVGIGKTPLLWLGAEEETQQQERTTRGRAPSYTQHEPYHSWIRSELATPWGLRLSRQWQGAGNWRDDARGRQCSYGKHSAQWIGQQLPEEMGEQGQARKAGLAEGFGPPHLLSLPFPPRGLADNASCPERVKGGMGRGHHSFLVSEVNGCG